MCFSPRNSQAVSSYRDESRSLRTAKNKDVREHHKPSQGSYDPLLVLSRTVFEIAELSARHVHLVLPLWYIESTTTSWKKIFSAYHSVLARDRRNLTWPLEFSRITYLTVLHPFMRQLSPQLLQLRNTKVTDVDAIEQGQDVAEASFASPIIRAVGERPGPRRVVIPRHHDRLHFLRFRISLSLASFVVKETGEENDMWAQYTYHARPPLTRNEM